MNFYKHFLGDYARDTAHLSMMEHGAYRLMLDHYYATGKSLPADKGLLYRICKAQSKAERSAVDLVADAFFAINGDGSRHNKRADKEIADTNAYATAQAERANKRWNKQTDMPVHMPTHVQEQCPVDASHSHSQKSIKEKSRTVARSADASLPVRLGEGPVIETIPLVGQGVAEVCESYASEMDRLFPAVDVPQTLREIRAWNLVNPTRRKTRSGIQKHIAGWFQKVQNGGR